MECKNNFKISDVVKIFLPLLLAVLLQYAVTIIDIIFIFIGNVFSKEEIDRSKSIGDIMSFDYKQPMNLATITAAKFILYGIIFGIWYYKAYIKDTSKESSLFERIKATFSPISAIFLAIAGISAQFLVDGVLNICRNIFVDAFTEYDRLLDSVNGAGSSWLMLISVFILAPIAEEILFRGLILEHSKNLLTLPLAIIFQAFMFGVYHGNMIQGIYAFILGAVLGYLAYKFDSIIPCILFHMAINVSIALVPEALLATTVSCIITSIASFILLVVFLYFALKSNQK